ncbi:hypothetical protein B0T10DRAFT_490254 [Thelonectria olida]|uniref:Zn(2)-C6 fungal-type domain-containing protein n=1 Tax=Thelonectria olida TaxID=1576542 RepID=A0A9P8W2Z8_9HYPO|nr:hypothetical protein B0T10DRAFT_490254 [Thelonectria olida]
MHPGQKRPSEDDESNPGQYPSSGGIHCNDNTRLKLARPGNNSENNDFSALVKHRLASYTRTGQACDRCKIRKIRCDAGPDGCHHCKGGGLGCFVTDRVTGRTERRGYLKELENHTRVLDARIRDLEKLLERKGIKVKPCEKTLELSPSHDASKDDSQQPDEASPSETISDEANPSETKPDDGDDGRWERLGTVLFRDISSNPVLNPDLQEALLVSHPAEQDTPNKNNTPDPRQSLPALKQEQSWPNPGVVTMPTSQAAPATAAFVPDTIPAAVPDGLTQSGEAPIQFFSEPNYSQLPFNEQPQNNLNPPTYGPDGSLYFNQID